MQNSELGQKLQSNTSSALNAGMASKAVLARLTRIGQGFLKVPSGLAALQAILHTMSSCTPSSSVVAVNPFKWRTYTAAVGLDPLPHFFNQVAAQKVQDTTLLPVAVQPGINGNAGKSKAADTTAAVLSEAAIAGQVQAALQGILGDSISPNDPLMSAGLDSLGSVELANVLARRFALQLPGTLIFDYPTVNAIAAYLHSRLKALAPATATAATPAVVSEPNKAVAAPIQQQLRGVQAQAVAIVSIAHQPMTAMHHVGADSSITWDLDYILPVPSTRWDTDAASGQQHSAHSMQARFGGFMEAVDLFDAAAFGLSGSEASSMDPQQRCLLQCSAEALSSAKQGKAQQNFSKSGVFIGVSWTEYAKLAGMHGMPVGAYTAQSAVLSVAAGTPMQISCRLHTLHSFKAALCVFVVACMLGWTCLRHSSTLLSNH